MKNHWIYCRALHDYRRMFAARSSAGAHLKILSQILAAPLALAVMYQVYYALVEWVRRQAHFTGSMRFGLFLMGSLAVGIVFLLSAASELLRELGTAGDRYIQRLCPVNPRHVALYRLLFASLRTLPFSPAIGFFPVYFAWSFYSSWQLALMLAGVAAFYAWCFVVALWIAARLQSCAVLRIPRLLYMTVFNALLMLISVLGFYRLCDRRHWDVWLRRLEVDEFSPATILLILFLLFATGWILFRHAALLMPRIVLEEGARDRLVRHVRGPMRFSGECHWAILQKDLLDLIRNPAYRYGFLSCFLLLPLALWTQWKSGHGTYASWRRMMSCLSFLYLVPLFFSARSVSLELRMLALYQLLWSGCGRLLDLKWRAQTIVNCLIVFALSLPYFVLVEGGPRQFEGAYFAACAVACVPLFTMLAIALGTYFPVRTAGINLLGINKWGVIVYLMTTVMLYSFLLNYMIAAALIYSSILLPATLLLYFGARRHAIVLSCLGGVAR